MYVYQKVRARNFARAWGYIQVDQIYIKYIKYIQVDQIYIIYIKYIQVDSIYLKYQQTRLKNLALIMNVVT